MYESGKFITFFYKSRSFLIDDSRSMMFNNVDFNSFESGFTSYLFNSDDFSSFSW